MSIEILFHHTHLDPAEYITGLMQRRVRQGHPEEIVVKIDDEPTIAYGWTDGIDSILSIFISINFISGIIKEILFIDGRTHSWRSPYAIEVSSHRKRA